MTKKPIKFEDRPYRPCVGIMLVNEANGIFVGSRVDTPGENWQMPQGGIDKGETPREAALRELEEEVGTNQAEIIAESADWHAYDIPPALSDRIWKGKYRGQTQRWFLMRFLGKDEDIVLDRHVREFSDWRWTPIDQLVDHIVPFKRDIYEKVITEFAPLLSTSKNT